MKHAQQPLISVIVAVYNGGNTLQQCIDSFARQTYPNKELIIIDGGSKDGTVELLKKNNNSINYWISEPDHGIYNAWNKGLQQAKGEWICFLGADDYFWNGLVLEKMGERLAKIPADVRVVYGQIMLLSNEGESLYPIGGAWQEAKGCFRQVMSIPHPGLMHRRSLFEQRGVFDESFRIAGDYEFLLRELKSADAIFIPDLISVGMRQGGISSSSSNSLKMMWEARRAQKLHGQYLPGLIWIMAVARIYIRVILWNSLGEQRAKKLLDLGRRLKGLPPYWTKT